MGKVSTEEMTPESWWGAYTVKHEDGSIKYNECMPNIDTERESANT